MAPNTRVLVVPRACGDGPLNPARYTWRRSQFLKLIECCMNGKVVGTVARSSGLWKWEIRCEEYIGRMGYRDSLHEARFATEWHHDDWMAKQAERVLEHEDVG